MKIDLKTLQDTLDHISNVMNYVYSKMVAKVNALKSTHLKTKVCFSGQLLMGRPPRGPRGPTVVRHALVGTTPLG